MPPTLSHLLCSLPGGFKGSLRGRSTAGPKWLLLFTLFGSILGSPVFAADDFIVGNILVRGNEAVDTGTVLSYAPVRAGERFTAADSSRIIRALYNTELFDDVSLSRDDTTLIISVGERPTIANIELEGNDSLPAEMLNDTLREIGLASGRIFRRSVLDNLETEVRQAYFSRGQYGTRVESSVEELDRNRVDVSIDIEEGAVARISHVNIAGNEDFSEETLLKLLASGTRSWNPFSSRDNYSRSKLAADTETLRAFYFDRGYLKFDIKSTQVTISPDKSDINITINIDEGERYNVGDIRFSATDVNIDDAELERLAKLKSGEIYSRKTMVEGRSDIIDRLGEQGFAFPNVDPVPELDDTDNTVSLNYNVNPGQRVYVRRIIFNGQQRTQDEVLRREMRQMEGSGYSPLAIKRSQTRIQRLPYIERVSISTPRVPGSEDMVDVLVNVTEGASGSFGAGAGYGSDGLILNVNFTQENLFGSGERLAFSFDNSSSQDNLSVSYTDPYYTNDGISRNVRAFIRKTDTVELESQANYILDSYGAKVRYGVPLSEFSTFSFGAGYERVEAIDTPKSTPSVTQFIERNGNKYDLFDLNIGYAHDTRNRTVFATDGARHAISLDATSPNSDLSYIKLGYSFEFFQPLSDNLTLAFTSKINYGEGEEGLDELPFFRTYFAGGIQSVRGYRRNSLGPRDLIESVDADGNTILDDNGNPVLVDGDAIGGDFRTLGSLELIFPPPFTEANGATRLSLFADFGNVFKDASNFDADELRGSYGLSFVWLAPVGPLTFSYAKTFNDEPGDERDNFQFTIGTLF